MCKSSNSTTTVQQPEIPDWLEGAFKGVISKAGQVANTPFNPATMRNVASFSGDQNAAFQQARDMTGNWQPNLNTAAGFAQQAGSTIAPSAINQYMNPFQGQVIDATMANIGQNNALQQQQLQGNAALQGALGGDRVKVAQAELARQQGLAANQTFAGLNAQNFNQALGAAQADRTAAGNAATQFGSLANQVSALGAGDYSRLLAQGGLQQGLGQQMLDTSSANAAAQSQYPFALTGWEQGVYTGAAPNFTGYTSTATGPSPSPLNSILGLGAMGLGAYMGMPSDERLKEDIVPVGELFDGTPLYKYRLKGDPRTQVGVMAQDIEGDKPEAVHELGGIKFVDYDAATKPSQGLAARKGFAEGGDVEGSGLYAPGNVVLGGRRQQDHPGSPYRSVNSYIPSQASQTLGAFQAPPMAKPPPPPKRRDEDQDDPIKMFQEAKKAASGLNSGLGQIIGKMDTTSGPGGWSTSVQPTTVGLGNYLGNMMGRADGGRVGYKKGGEVGLPETNPWDMYRRMFGTVPGWIAQGLGSPPAGTPMGTNASGVSPALQGGLLPAGAAFNQLGGGFGALVDTDSLLSGGATQQPGFSNVASGVMPTPPPAPPPPPTIPVGGGGSNDDDFARRAYGGRVGYNDGGEVDPNQAQMPQIAPQAGLAPAPGMMPQGMPMPAMGAPMGLGGPMPGMMPGAMPPGMPGQMPMGAPGPMPALPPPGGMQPPMPPPGQPQGGVGQPIIIPPRSAPYGRKVLEKQMAREKGLGSRAGFESGGVVDGFYDPVDDVWKVTRNVAETPGSQIGSAPSDPEPEQPSSSPSMFENARSGKYSWLAEPLITAGAAMMASPSPFPGVAVGQGGLAGIKQYRQGQEAEALARKAQEQMDFQRAQLNETIRHNKAAEAKARDPYSMYGKTGAVFQGKDGRFYTIQFAGDGSRQILPVESDGVALEPAKGVTTVDEGTQTRIITNASGQDVRAIPKNIAGAEAAKIEGKARGEAIVALPKVIDKTQEAVALIDQMIAHPGRATATGLSGSLDPRNYFAGTDATNFSVMRKQLQGKVFQEAFESLKGGGQITEVEGLKAEQAKARLETAQSDEAFIEALNELKGIMARGLARARQAAGVSATNPVPNAENDPLGIR